MSIKKERSKTYVVVVMGIKKLSAGGGNQIQERISHDDMHTLPMYSKSA
jgi:hypothetical protein